MRAIWQMLGFLSAMCSWSLTEGFVIISVSGRVSTEGMLKQSLLSMQPGSDVCSGRADASNPPLEEKVNQAESLLKVEACGRANAD